MIEALARGFVDTFARGSLDYLLLFQNRSCLRGSPVAQW